MSFEIKILWAKKHPTLGVCQIPILFWSVDQCDGQNNLQYSNSVLANTLKVIAASNVEQTRI